MIDDLLNVDWASFLWEEVEKRGDVKIDPTPIKSGEPSQDADETLAHVYTIFEVPDNWELGQCAKRKHSLEDFHSIYSRPALMSLAREIVGMGMIKVGCLPFVPTHPGNRMTITYGKIPVRFQVGYQSSDDGLGKYVVTLDVLVEEIKTMDAVGV